MGLRLALSALAVGALIAAPQASGARHASALLGTAFGLSHAETARVETGHVLTRTLDAANPREVATLGIVRIETTPAAYVARLMDIATFKRTRGVLQIGTFGSQPQPADLASLTIDEGDLKRLRTCRVGDCDVRLPADAIERFRRAVDWRSPDAPRQANGVLRELLADYVARYRAGGAAAAMEYAGTAPPLNVGREFAALVGADTDTWTHAPALRRHLLEYPAAADEGIVDFVYWSKELVHRRPVISVTHVAIAAAGDGSPVRYAVGSKQIYAMHYFDASLGLTLLIHDGRSPAATYVVYLNRSRIDLFQGVFGGVARRVVAGKARSLVAEQLERLQRVFAAGGPPDSSRTQN
jgi:hypothetical protein